MSLWLPEEAYAVLSSLARNWTQSRTAVLIRLILKARNTKLRIED